MARAIHFRARSAMESFLMYLIHKEIHGPKSMLKKLEFGEPEEWTRLCERKAESTFGENQET
jgi:hypothetical protein